MDMNEILTMLGLIRRAGHLAVGADDVSDSCLKGKGRLILLAQDASGVTAKWMDEVSQQKEVPMRRLNATKQMLGEALGVGQCAVVNISDSGFAIAMSKKMEEAELTALLEARQVREKRRKAKKLARSGGMSGKKRGK